MAIYIVTYDLNRETKRPPIVKSIKKYSRWAKLSESSYAVETSRMPKQVYDDLAEHLDENDQIYIISLYKPWYGFGPEKVNEWLDNNLPES